MRVNREPTPGGMGAQVSSDPKCFQGLADYKPMVRAKKFWPIWLHARKIKEMLNSVRMAKSGRSLVNEQHQPPAWLQDAVELSKGGPVVGGHAQATPWCRPSRLAGPGSAATRGPCHGTWCGPGPAAAQPSRSHTGCGPAGGRRLRRGPGCEPAPNAVPGRPRGRAPLEAVSRAAARRCHIGREGRGRQRCSRRKPGA